MLPSTAAHIWTHIWANIIDLRRAFRQIRIDPLDWPLICVSWDNAFYVNISVAFGVRHGAAFTQRLSQAVCDILDAKHITTIPYIDDYIGAHPSLSLANTAYNRSIQLFQELGLELNPKKCVRPTTSITWIGVVFDSQDMTMRIPPTVITDTIALVHTWLHKSTATRHELQILLGKLFHAGKCCLAARLFVGRMLPTLRATTPSGSTTLTHSFRADLQWWNTMLPLYNGRLLIQLTRPTHHIYIDLHDSDISIFTSTHSTTIPNPPIFPTNTRHGANRELFAVLGALTLWGTQWVESELLIHCNNTQRLQVLVHGRSRIDTILDIARRIWLITAGSDIHLTPTQQGELPHQATAVVAPPIIHLC
jgi:hypothetical protein